MKLFFDVEGWKLEGEEPFLAWLRGEFQREGAEGDVNLVLVDNEVIEELNVAYLGHEGPTDVISFNLDDEDEDEFVVVEDEESVENETDSGEIAFPAGEVYVSLEMADLQAREYQVSLTDEVSRLMLHGVLHIAGWLDDSDENRAAMSRREDEGLARARGEGGTLPWNLRGPAAMEG